MANYGTTVGYFKTQSAAEAAMSALQAAGFQQNQIGVAAASGAGHDASTSSSVGEHANGAGAHVAGMWDKVKSFFDGGNTAEPYAGETQKGTFNDNEITSSPNYSSEHVQHSLGGLDVSDEHSRYFSHQLSTGQGIVLTVSAPGREEEVASIIEANGGDIGRSASQYDYSATAVPASPATPTTGEQNIQLYGEVLRVHKDRVSSGEVRLRKEVLTTTQTIEVPVTREELVIERVPVAGEQVASNASFAEQEIRVPLTEERAYVDKQAVLREEVHVGKREVADVESFNEQVRSEDLKVDSDPVVEKSSTR